MPKHQKRRKGSESQEEEVEDIMAWGNRKENYYQQSQDEYSQLSEEEQQAKKIYENQLQELENEDLYQIPQAAEQDDEEEQDQQQNESQLSHAYLTKEIKNIARLGVKVSAEPDSKTKGLLQSYVQTYLLSLIALRELDIPHVEYHPILNQIMQMKQDISKLRALLETSTHHEEEDLPEESFSEEVDGEEQDDEANDEEQAQEESQEEQEVNHGLRLYEQAKLKHEAAKKLKKQENKSERQKKKKPMFAQVKQSEGRLANEKILKNKGLLKKRKKIDRNGRVKLRRKFDKATSKRRAYGHTIRENPGRQYQGQRNIKYGRIASTKLK